HQIAKHQRDRSVSTLQGVSSLESTLSGALILLQDNGLGLERIMRAGSEAFIEVARHAVACRRRNVDFGCTDGQAAGMRWIDEMLASGQAATAQESESKPNDSHGSNEPNRSEEHTSE